MLTSIGGGVQQSSFYGLTAMLPPKFTMALMIGESVAGVLASLNRITTKASYDQTPTGLRESAFSFFYISLAFLVACMVIYECVRRSALVQYYTASSALTCFMTLVPASPEEPAAETRFEIGCESDAGELSDFPVGKTSASGYAPVQVFTHILWSCSILFA